MRKLLKPRELEILRELANGRTNKEIARKLSLSPNTVKWYNKQIFATLAVSNRMQAVQKALDLQLLCPEPLEQAVEKQGSHHNLPAIPASFIGRHQETAEITALLKKERLLTLIGPGGCGKTRLAIHVAWDLIGYFPDGVWFVDLAPLQDIALIANAILQAIGVNYGNSIPQKALLSYLAPRHILLLLDSFEHLLEGAHIIGELLTGAPDLTVLSTSREPLKVYGEREFLVRPLPLPDPIDYGDWDHISSSDSVRLFLERAQAVNPEFVPHPVIGKICTRLDGLPLAIELAATQTRIYSAEQLSDLLHTSLGFLPKGPRDVPDRQRTLQATIEWSFDLLTAEEKNLFLRMGVFNGGADQEAVEKVCLASAPGGSNALLTALVEKNLLWVQRIPDGRARFRMLETIREFSLTRLGATDQVEQLREQHAAYYTGMVEAAEDEIRGKRQDYWFDKLRMEIENIRAVLKWSLSGKNSQFGLRMVSAISYFWIYGGNMDEARGWVERALGQVHQAPPIVVAGVKRTAGCVLGLTDPKVGVNLLEEAIGIYELLGEQGRASYARGWLGVFWVEQEGGISEGLAFAKKGLEFFYQTKEAEGIAFVLNTMGEMCRLMGDLESAEQYYEECLEVSIHTGEKLRVPLQYYNLGLIANLRGDFQKGRSLFRKGIEGFLDLGHEFAVIDALGCMAGSFLSDGRLADAAQILGFSETRLEEIGACRHKVDEIEVNRYITACRNKLGTQNFEQAWKAGAQLTLDEAIAFVFEAESFHPVAGPSKLR
jgi:non-specific serine/threonine protein kinase